MELKEIRVTVPTYYGNSPDKEKAKQEWGDPQVPVLIQPDMGVRLLLGTHDKDGQTSPDIYIERRPGGWVIFLHPESGDPAGYVYILDDGSVLLQKEQNADVAILKATAKQPAELNVKG